MDLPILIFAFLCASLLRLSFSTAETSDQWVSFWLISRQRRQRWITYEARDSIVPGIYGYPSLQHFLISRLPRRSWGIAGRLTNILYDLITGGCVYWLASHIDAGAARDQTIAGLSFPAAATILFLTTPALLPATSRLLAIKGRAMGMMWVAIHLVALQQAYLTGAWWWYAIAIVTALLIILTSMFAMQVALFFSLFLALFLLSPAPLLVIAASIALGLVLPRLGTRPALLFMWNHKRWYLRNYRKGTTASERNRWRDMLQLPAILLVDPKKFIRLSTSKITPIIGVLSAPLAFLVVIFVLADARLRDLITGESDLGFLFGIALASLVLFVLTSFPLLSSFGQAERYFEYSAYSFSILGVAVLGFWSPPARDSLFWLLLLWHLAVIAYNFTALRLNELWRADAQIPPALEEAIRWCDASLEGGRILTVPCKLGFLFSSRLNRSRKPRFSFYHKFIQRPGESAFGYYERDTGGLIVKNDVWMESKEIFSRPPLDLAREYGATHFIVERKHLEGLARTWGAGPADILGPPVFENTGYVMYAVPEAPAAPSAAGGASR